MTLRDSTGLPRSENSRVHRSAYRVARKSGISPTHVVGKFWRLTNFLATIVNWRKQDRYFDTGESGEWRDIRRRDGSNCCLNPTLEIQNASHQESLLAVSPDCLPKLMILSPTL